MKCWFCGKETMKEAPDLGSGWFRCGECGATWIKMPELAEVALGGIWKDKDGIGHYHSVKVGKSKGKKK